MPLPSSFPSSEKQKCLTVGGINTSPPVDVFSDEEKCKKEESMLHHASLSLRNLCVTLRKDIGTVRNLRVTVRNP